MSFTRRRALMTGAVLPLAAAAGGLALPSAATAQAAPVPLPTHRSFMLGGFRVTTLLSGSRPV